MGARARAVLSAVWVGSVPHPLARLGGCAGKGFELPGRRAAQVGSPLARHKICIKADLRAAQQQHLQARQGGAARRAAKSAAGGQATRGVCSCAREWAARVGNRGIGLARQGGGRTVRPSFGGRIAQERLPAVGQQGGKVERGCVPQQRRLGAGGCMGEAGRQRVGSGGRCAARAAGLLLQRPARTATAQPRSS